MKAPRASSARAAAALLALALASCAGPPSLMGDVFVNAQVAFRINPVPPGWHPIHLSDADLVYRDAAHDASILVNGRCAPGDSDTPLSALTEHLIMGTTDREFLVEETLPFDAREARHTVLKAKLDGVLMGYDVFVMKKDGCVYDLVYFGAPEGMQAGTPPFETFARGFHALAKGG
jgi:hypothetical protein